MAQEKEPIVKAPSGRVRRIPLSGRNVLTVQGKDPNYAYRIVNDEEDRIARFQDAGYELVADEDVTVGDKRVSKPTAEGTVKQISVGGGKKAFLMRIRKDWYEEDQKAKQDFVDRQEATTKQKALSGTYGSLVYGNEELKGSESSR
jgi:hypothetical protein